MKCIRRVNLLESLQCASLSAPLRAVRNDAFDRLDHSDRKVISELAFQYQSGDEVGETSEVQRTLARWGDLIALLAGHPQEASRSLN